MKKKQKKVIEVAEVVLLFYALLFAILFFEGCTDANSNYGKCNKNMSRLEYVFPAYKFDCFMNKELP